HQAVEPRQGILNRDLDDAARGEPDDAAAPHVSSAYHHFWTRRHGGQVDGSLIERRDRVLQQVTLKKEAIEHRGLGRRSGVLMLGPKPVSDRLEELRRSASSC